MCNLCAPRKVGVVEKRDTTTSQFHLSISTTAYSTPLRCYNASGRVYEEKMTGRDFACDKVRRQVTAAVAAAESGVLNRSLLALSIIAALCVVATIAVSGTARGKTANILSILLVIVSLAVVLAYYVLKKRAPHRKLASEAQECHVKELMRLPASRHKWEELAVLMCVFASFTFTIRCFLVRFSRNARQRNADATAPTTRRPRNVDAVLDALRVNKDDAAVQEDDACAICLDEWGQGALSKLRCNHVFHQLCIAKWMSAAHPNYGAHCPVCKADIVPEDDPEMKHVFDSPHNTASASPAEDSDAPSPAPVAPAAVALTLPNAQVEAAAFAPLQPLVVASTEGGAASGSA